MINSQICLDERCYRINKWKMDGQFPFPPEIKLLYKLIGFLSNFSFP